MSARNLILDQMTEPAKQAADYVSVATLVATLFHWVPQISALLVLIWTLLRIYESWLTIAEKRDARRRAAAAAPVPDPRAET